MKKVVIIASIIIICGIIAAGYYYLKRQSPVDRAVPVEAVPVNSCLIFEFRDFAGLLEKVTGTNQICNEIFSLKPVKRLNEQVVFLDSLFTGNTDAGSLIQDKTLILSLHMTGKEKYDYIYIIGLGTEFEKDQAEKIMSELLNGKAKIAERTYSDVKIHDVIPTDKESIRNFSYAVADGVFIFSFSSILVEDAVRQMRSENSIATISGYTKVRNTAGKNVEGNMYINYSTFPKLISIFLDDGYKQFIRSFDNLADWSELDINLKDKVLLLNGFTYSNDSVNNYLNIFLDRSPQRIDLVSVLPANTSALLALGIDDFAEFNKSYKNYLRLSGEINDYENKIESINNGTGTDIETIMFSFMDKELALAYTDINILNIHQNEFVILGTKGKSRAEEGMMEILQGYAKQKNISFEALKYNYNIDNEISFPIYKMPYKKFMHVLFGNLFSDVETGYFTFIDNYLVFGNSVKSLSSLIHQNVLQKTLSIDVNYNQFSDYLSSKSNFYFYSNLALSPVLFSAFLNDDLKPVLDSNRTAFQKFHALGIQFSSDKEMIYNNIFLKYNPVYKEPPHTVWESHLDTITEIKPAFVTNHYTKEREIFIQDINNNCYLINATGRIIWKIKMEEPIISDIYQIDYFENKKLQILFSTKDAIHLIDRNGNYVERYPVKLRSPATNGIALFDYEQNRDYRIFVACENRQVYAYNKEGNILEGWEFEKSESKVYNRIQHFRVKDKDYIVFADSLKTYILDRRGNVRVKPELDVARSANNIFYMESFKDIKKSRIVTTDTSGLICFIRFDGNVDTLRIRDCSQEHFFNYKDIDGDGHKDLIFVDRNELAVYNKKRSLIMSYGFNNEITERPVFYIFPDNKRKLGIVSSLSNELFLINDDGSLYEGFPLKGKTLFSIGHLGKNRNKFNLIVGSNENYLYNYEVN